MADKLIVHALPAGGDIVLGFAKASVQSIGVSGVDVVLTLADGTQHVVQGLALRLMTDTSLRLVFTDTRVDGANVLGDTGKVILADVVTRTASAGSAGGNDDPKHPASKDDAAPDSPSTPADSPAEEAPRPAPAPVAGLTAVDLNGKSSQEASYQGDPAPAPPPQIILTQSASSSSPSAPPGNNNPPPPPPPPAAAVSISFNAHNVTGQTQTTLDGKTVITGSGGVAASATDHSPTVQAAREQIAGTIGDDIIYGDGGSDMGPGFARVLEIQLSAKNALEVSSVTLTGLPTGFIPVGATQQGSSWELKLPSDLAANGNLLTVMLQYPVASDDSAFNATPFNLSITASGTMDGKTISGQLVVPAIVRDVQSASDMDYKVSGQTGLVLPAFGLGDEIHAGAGNDTVYALVGHDKVYGDEGDDKLDGGQGNDWLVGGEGADELIGSTGSDTASYEGSALGVNVDLSTGAATGGDAQGDSFSSIENLTGGSMADVLRGDATANRIDGAAGNDLLEGRGGADVLVGGAGIDTATYASSSAGVSVDLAAGSGKGGDAEGDTLADIENLTGSAHDDTLKGNAQANELEGGAGDDVLQGRGGADVLHGGAGDNTASYADSAAGVKVSLATGSGSAGDAAGDRLQDIQNLIGSASADELTGDGGVNRLDGGTGDDVLTGGLGADALIGGDGNDTASYVDALAAVTASLADPSDGTGEAAGDSYDSIENLEGSELDDTLIGDDNANILIGNPGDDLLAGGDGDDTLIGGAGADTIDGGAGTDTVTYADSSAGVTVDLSGGLAGSGGDAQGDVIANVENAIGSRFSDRLIGDAGNNVLDGGRGNDTLAGGAGADELIGGDGSDTADYASSGAGVQIDLATGLTAGGDAAGDTFDSIENLAGTGLDDQLTGDAGANKLTGNAGRDTLSGNAGNDTLDGGDGDDLLDGGRGGDNLIGGAGNDTVTYAASSAGVQVNLATGIGHGGDAEGDKLATIENIVGSAHDDSLVGNAGVNLLDGGLGDDVLEGGDGADVLDGGDGSDTASYAGASAGVTASLWAPGANTGAAAGDSYDSVENLAGSAYADVLAGDAAANVIDGGLGDDWIEGHGGADTLRGGAGTDTASYASSAAAVQVDLVAGTGSGGDAQGNLLESIENVLGGAYADTLKGNAADNQLDGGAGDDLLEGGLGADALLGGAGNDTATYANATASVSASLASAATNTGEASGDTYNSIENLIGSASNDTLEGDSGTNLLVGGLGDDTLIGGAGADVLQGGVGTDTASYAGAASAVLANLANRSANTGDAAGDLYDSIENLTGSSRDDTLVGDSAGNRLDGGAGNDLLIGGLGADTLVGAAGTDTASYAASSTGVSVNLSSGQGSGGDAQGDRLEGVENLVGSSHDDTLAGDGGSNRLDGGTGNDTLDGAGGADTMAGGAGDDSYAVDNAGDLVIEAAGEGTDSVGASLSYTLTANVENLTLLGSAGIDGTGNAAANVITGNAGANVIDGGAGADTMIGAAGDDTYVVDDASDAIVEDENAGTDSVLSSVTHTLEANVENLTLTGSSAIDAIGNALNNSLAGNSGANTLDGGTGADAMAGGAGDDTYLVDNAGDSVTENVGEGTDTVRASVSFTLGANIENLLLAGNAAINGTGNAAANQITGNSASNVIDGGGGADTMLGGAGNDTYIVDNTGDVTTENVSEGTDLVQASVSYTLAANVENLVLTGNANINGIGNALDNQLTGNGAANTLDGAAGNDTLDGGSGADTLIGGTGNDTYVVDNTGDVIVENSGEGSDLVSSSVTYALSSNVENLTLTGSSAINGTGNGLANTLIGNGAANTLDGGSGADTMLGGAGNDTYIVDDTGDTIIENAGEGIDGVQSSVTYTLAANLENLTLTGTAAIDGTGNALDNTLTGNSAANTLTGGAGNDTYVVDNVGDVVVEAIGEGTDLVRSSVTYALAANVENLTLTGTAAIDGTGNSLANTITGNTGANTLDGGSGADTMIGSAGNDTYLVDDAGDLIAENSGEGTDLVRASVTYTLAANVENLTLTGSSAIDGTGNALDNALIGNSAANILTGGAGNDTYVVDNTGDVVVEAAGEGSDLVLSSVTYTLSADVENLTLTGNAAINATGNALDNTLIGNAAANTLDGGSGADSLIGGAGNDLYVVDNTGDTVTENVGEGTDSVQSSVTFTLAANVENLTLTGTSSIDGTGNALDNVLTGNSAANLLTGGAGNDTYVVDNAGDVVVEAANEGTDLVLSSVTYGLSVNVEKLTLTGNAAINATGNALDNTLTGNTTANTLDGGTGADTMIGGAGNDTYIVDNTGDVTTENISEGTDNVQSSVTYTLAANIENLTLTGAAAINATGNALDNTLTGNAAANTLDGGAGADTMVGGAGNDTYVVDNTGDVVTESSAEGTDTVQSSITYTLAANVENLTLTGTAAIDGTGNALANTITGNSSANTLDGGAGADTMIGGSGDDTYLVDNTADVVTEGVSGGTDNVRSSVTYTLAANVEQLTLTGSANINGTGNTLDNTITGNSGVNVIDGGSGADSMAGGANSDVYIVDNVGDTVTENSNEGYDTVRSSVAYTLAANVEMLILTGTSAISGTGNAGDNQIIGNSGANTLNGGAGNDVLDGGSGADTMIGGTGNDIFAVDNAGDVVTENAAEGNDTVVASVTYTAGSNVENLVLSGSSAINATGNTSDNLLVGNTGANILSAGAGNDTLNGGGGADSMIGGTGNDTYWVDNAGDTVTENASEGTDNVYALVSATLAANVENGALRDSVRLDSSLKQYVTLPTVTVGGDMTMQAWVYLPSSQGTWTRLFDTATASSDNVIVAFNGTNVMLGTYVGSTGSTTLTSSAAMGTGWHQVSVTIDAQGTSTIYIDGNASGSNTQGVPADLARTFLVGKSGWAADPYGNYLVNDVRIWDRALTAAEIQANITPGSLAGTETGLVVYQPLNGTLASGLPGGATATYNSGVTYTGNASTYAGAIDLTGNSLDNNLTGNALANTLTGNSGNNVIDGGTGADTMIGGAGNDTYVVDNTGDVVTEVASAGTDTIQSSVTYTLPTNVENLVLTGSANINATGATLSGVMAGNTGNNTITGSSSASWLYGGTGTDALVGGAGSDVLISGTRPQAGLFAEYFNNTTFTGSAITTRYENVNQQTDGSANTGLVNVDGFSVRWSGQLLAHAAGSHQFKIFGDDVMTVTIDGVQIINQTGYTGAQSAPVTLTLTAGYHSIVVTLVDTGGTAAAQLYWQGPNDTSFAIVPLNDLSATASTNDGTGDTLTGNAGNDLLMGSTGADNMIGGIGNDTYIVDNAGDVVTEAASAGTDTVQSTISYTLGSNVEQLVLAGASAINGTGNTLANTLTGNSAANVLDGGTGADTMIGGAGNDTYVVDNIADVVTENSNEGTDAVQASVTYTLGANVESLTLTGASAINGTGNALDNTLTGNTAANTLDGGTGADTMIGGVGNDTYVVDNAGDVVTENSGEGTDTVQASVTYTLAANVENLTLTGAAAINATGNTLDNTLTGNAAANTLDGGSGVDTMAGGAGNDTYIVDNIADVTTENTNEGTDAVQASVTYTLAVNVENLTLTGAAAINATGNALDNVLTGNAAANTLDGGTGADTMVGGAGNDSYVVDNTGDVTTENASEGTDVVLSSVTYTLAANLENLTLTGASAINGTGNSLANTITGNSGANTLDGGTGADTMIGGIGNDSYVVDNIGDVITENSGEGTDTVLASLSYTLAANVENLMLTGASAINGTGNALANTITGNSAANTLDGGTGADSLIGGAGNDTYVVDNAGDVVTENSGEGTDTVQSAVTHTLSANVENLTLTGASAIDGTGNALDNVLVGNIAANTLTGGAGNDTYVVDNAGDLVIENNGEGTDTVQSSVTHTLSANVENLTLTGSANIDGTGNALDNTLAGNAGNGTLDGAGGNDVLVGGSGIATLHGGAGDDTLVVADVGHLAGADGGIGNDLLQFTSPGLAFDLTSLHGVAQNIEAIDLRNGAGGSVAQIDLQSLQSITDARADLVLHLDNGDTFQLSGETELLGSSTANGTTQSDYALYASNDHSAGPAATLHVLVGG